MRLAGSISALARPRQAWLISGGAPAGRARTRGGDSSRRRPAASRSRSRASRPSSPRRRRGGDDNNNDDDCDYGDGRRRGGDDDKRQRDTGNRKSTRVNFGPANCLTNSGAVPRCGTRRALRPRPPLLLPPPISTPPCLCRPLSSTGHNAIPLLQPARPVASGSANPRRLVRPRLARWPTWCSCARRKRRSTKPVRERPMKFCPISVTIVILQAQTRSH